MCCRRQAGMDREGRDVGLVDHQPHPAVADDVVVDPGDEVAREAVRLELAPIRVGGPRRAEAGLLDGVHVRQVLEPHRLDRDPYRGSRDHSTSPCSPRDPARQRHVFGHELGEIVRVAGGDPGRPEPDERGAEPGARDLAEGDRRRVRAPVQVDRHEGLAVPERRFGARRQEHGRLAGPDQHPIGRSGRQQQDRGRAAGRARPAAPRPWRCPRSAARDRVPGPSPSRVRPAGR